MSIAHDDFLFGAIILGALPSMKNNRRIFRTKAGRTYSIKSEAALKYEQHFMSRMVGKDLPNYAGEVSLFVTVWYPTKRNDLDIELLKDLIQKAGIIQNDRQIVHVSAGKRWDKENPRVTFSIYRGRRGDG